MFDGFTPFDIETQTNPTVSIHGIINKSSSSSLSGRPAILLLHGWPQTHHIWHLIAPLLSTRYTLIAIDLRGYGSSSKPTGVPQYVKSVMARDAAVVMSKLGYDNYFVVAHDRGARVAHKLLVDYPSRIRKAILIDICPTLAMFSFTNQEFATAYWHWFFLIQKSPLPETMILNDARRFAELFMGGNLEKGIKTWGEEHWEIYVKGLSDAESVHGMCEEYRAAASLDLDESRRDLEQGRKIKTPLRILWGKGGLVERSFDAVGEWKKVSEVDVEVTGQVVDCGHYIPEERPEELVKHILGFFV